MLSGDQEVRLKQLLEGSLGKTVEVEVAVDQDLLGGFVVQVGSDRYDVSLKGELERMANTSRRLGAGSRYGLSLGFVP